MNKSSQSAAEQERASNRAGDILDVHLLDIAAQLEAILRSVRHVQSGVLRLRGALPADEGPSPVDDVRERLGLMQREWAALGEAIGAALDAADGLSDRLPDLAPQSPRTNT